MNDHSSLARLQQIGVLVLGAAGATWLAWWWRQSPALAVAGALLIWFGYSLFLAVEFVALRFAGRDDSVPPPRGGELLRAWLAETWLNAVVFAWRQPFRWRTIPDDLPQAASARRGVVLIHGFVCNRGFWTPWLRQLRHRSIPYVAVNLEPVFGSIDEYPVIIEQAVQRITQATGLAPVLVCHSMGGLAARAWLRAAKDGSRVHHIITIGSPHRGTWFGQFSHMTNGRQMRLDGDWVRDLAAALSSEAASRFTCWYSNCDNIVFPVSTATLPGADNRLVRGRAHVELAFHPQVIAESLAIISA
jgi:predicted alpha/beta hydrolase family esterase